MNTHEFFAISKQKEEVENDFELMNLGDQRVFMITGKRVRDDWGYSKNFVSETSYTNTHPEDYDNCMASKLHYFDPIYELSNVLNYPLEYYILEKNGNKDKFIKHIKYTIIPKIKNGNYKQKDECIELILEWVKTHAQPNIKMNTPSNIEVKGSFNNSPILIQNNSDNSNQSIQVTSDQIDSFLKLLKEDLGNIKSDLKDELLEEISKAESNLSKGKNVNSRIATVWNIVKEIGISLFSKTTASLIYETIKGPLGLG
jgi:hypothetical protein